eukprot:TRINITY_DN2937_c1_g2_i1.p1 TRINITY_DN2937_c1_g2~~TRINITY_DN2937_c1_g2_i1.p1  ORF type:complete len:281 (+),score=89.72 TRINITY_DN2937_c1_g2_i1:113-955(+)
MCITAFLIRSSGRFRFIFIGNRDEYQKRQTMPLREEPEKGLLCARDAQAGGAQTMLNIRDGVLSTLTNVRMQQGNRAGTTPRSRGLLVEDAALGRPIDVATVHEYAGFNLMRCHLKTATPSVDYYTNCVGWGGDPLTRMAPGASCVSNSFMNDASWPKVTHLQAALERCADQPAAQAGSAGELMDQLAELLGETNVIASPSELPPQILADSPYGAAETDLQKGIWVSAQLPQDVFRTLAQTVVVSEHNEADPEHPTVHYWYRTTESPTEHGEWTKFSYVM